MLDLPFADHTFDVVIEKGTMDVLFVDNDQPFDARAEVKKRVFQMLHETHRYKPLCVTPVIFVPWRKYLRDCMLPVQ